jgi:hypothetical protein
MLAKQAWPVAQILGQQGKARGQVFARGGLGFSSGLRIEQGRETLVDLGRDEGRGLQNAPVGQAARGLNRSDSWAI